MRGKSKRIAILFHALERNVPPSSYIVGHLARFWKEEGHEITYLFGTKTYVPADLLLIHVNLSVVPDEYFAFASRYPIILNAQLRDIRKSVISANVVGPNDPWAGPVVVKSDLNSAGAPERNLKGTWLERHIRGKIRRSVARLAGRQAFTPWWKYRIYEHVAQVPEWLLTQRDVVVERFLPEREGDLFYLRVYQVLGDRWTCTRLASPSPIFKASMSVSSEAIDPHPQAEMWRREFNLDYGKLDYLIHDGQPVLIDVNKTTGASDHMGSAHLVAMRRRLAEGLYTYFTS